MERETKNQHEREGDGSTDETKPKCKSEWSL